MSKSQAILLFFHFSMAQVERKTRSDRGDREIAVVSVDESVDRWQSTGTQSRTRREAGEGTMPDFDYQTDVLIVGSGGAALVGALVVKEHGFEPLVVEKTAFVGGTTAWSGGGLWIPNNPVSRRAGLRDSFEEALRYMNEVIGDVGPASSPERRRAFLEYGPQMVEFLERLGFRWRPSLGYPDYYPEKPGGSIFGRSIEGALFDGRQLGVWLARLHRYPNLPSVPLHTNEASQFALVLRTPNGALTAARVVWRLLSYRLRGRVPLTLGASLIGQLLSLCLQRSIPIWLESPLVELLTEDGAVVGAVVQHQGRPVRIRARGGVLLAAGGFAHNREMRERYHPHPITTEWTSAAPATLVTRFARRTPSVRLSRSWTMPGGARRRSCRTADRSSSSGNAPSPSGSSSTRVVSAS